MSMLLKKQVIEDLKAAMKEGDGVKRDTLRMLDSMIKNVEIERKKREEGLSDEEVQEVIARAIKQRKDSVAQYEQGDRADLAEKEKKEIDILSAYMPEQLDEEKVRAIVRSTISETGASSSADMGKVMGPVMAKVKGQADGQVVRRIVEEELNK